MAKVYAPPEQLPAPDFEAFMPDGRFDFGAYDQACAAWTGRLREWVKGQSKHRLAGEVIRIPMADGYAQYMVFDGRQLIWLPLGDAWNVPEYQTRGLRVKDIEEMVEGDKALARIFGRKKEE